MTCLRACRNSTRHCREILLLYTCTCGSCLTCCLLFRLLLLVVEAELPVDALRPSALWVSALDMRVGEVAQLPLLPALDSSKCPADMQTVVHPFVCAVQYWGVWQMMDHFR